MPELDTMERVRILEELRSNFCRCGHHKAAGQSFCLPCIQRLPLSILIGLHLLMKDGYAEAYQQAVALLGPPARRRRRRTGKKGKACRALSSSGR